MRASKAQLKSLHPIRKRSDFLSVQRKGQKWVSHGVVIQVKPNDLDVTRVGFTVTKKTASSAVKRNRIKRRLRAVAAEILPVYAKPSTDYVLIGRVQTAARPFDTLCTDLKWCLKKTGYLKSKAKPE